MSNLKAIRDRIASVKNTKKITEAMRLVASAKVRRAQEQVLATRPFADKLAGVLYALQSRLQLENLDSPLLEQRDVKKSRIAGDFRQPGFVRYLQQQYYQTGGKSR